MRKNRVMAVVAVLVVLVSALSGSCKKNNTASGGEDIDRNNFNALGTFPLVKTKETITVMMGVNDLNTNMDDNLFTKYYEEKTNVHVNWVLAPGEQFRERVNLALMSGDDIDFIRAGFGSTDVQRYADDKLIVPLEDYIESDTANLKKNFDAIPFWRQAVTMPDGHIYSVPRINECLHCAYYGKMWVNMEFLKNVGLSIPTTPEEFRQMLTAFKTKDANGNGDPNDEIPFAGATGAYSAKVDTYLMSAFIYNDGQDRLYLENGKMVAAFQQPDFQEGLRYLRQLYSEGLISPDSFTMDVPTRQQLNSQNYATIGAIPFENHGRIGSRPPDEPARWLDYEPIPPLKGPKGLQVARYDGYAKFENGGTGGGGTIIPATSKKAALVMRFLDWFYTEEGAVWVVLGMKGLTWEEPDRDATGLDGKTPAAYKQLILARDDPRYPLRNWGQAWPNMRTVEQRNREQQPFDYRAPDGSGVERMLHIKTLENYAPYGWPMEKLVPPLLYGDDASELALLRTNINTYVDESIAKFVTGGLDVERDWTSFQANLKNLSIDRYLQINQNAYNSSAFVKK